MKHALYDGLDFDVVHPLELEAGGSFLEALVAVGTKVIDGFGLSETETAELSKAIAERGLTKGTRINKGDAALI